MAASQYQRDHEYGGDGLEAVLESENVRRIRQAEGWERDVSGNELPGNEDGFVELTEEECRQLELPKEWIA